MSVSGGAADYFLHSKNGVPQSAAILPRSAAQTYGRYLVRFKVDPGLRGWASAWLVWPDDDVWPAHGEMDWPEGTLDGTIGGFMHYADPTAARTLAYAAMMAARQGATVPPATGSPKSIPSWPRSTWR